MDSLRKTELNKKLNLKKKDIKEAKKRSKIQFDKQIKQFDTIFRSYKNKTGFDFHSADSLLIIFKTDIQTNLKQFIIISGNDTITYGEKWKMLGLHSFEREIVYKPFLDTVKQKGFIVISDRDSLITLATKRDFITMQKLAKENACYDGSTSTIIFAKKMDKHYQFEYHYLMPFAFVPIWRKE